LILMEKKYRSSKLANSGLKTFWKTYFVQCTLFHTEWAMFDKFEVMHRIRKQIKLIFTWKNIQFNLNPPPYNREILKIKKIDPQEGLLRQKCVQNIKKLRLTFH